MAIDEARQEDSNQGVIARGTVVVLPGVFGSQYLYIFDGSAGVQIYQYKKDFPELAVGDAVEVAGIVSVASGIKRIKIKNSGDIDILETDKPISPEQIMLSEIGEENAGSLVNFTGEITEIKTNYMYVDDGAGEITVYFKKGARIDKKVFKEGDRVAVTGVAEFSGGEIQVWPRGSSDISLVASVAEVKGEKIVADNNSKGTAKKYFMVTLGGLAVLLLGLLGRAKIIALNIFIQKLFRK
jgi:DNA/RNA endonuclease YhcR with UshA esterase domain